ncbi:Acetophenone carboxylase gamma subunit [Methylacidimicrobium sp. AP8]|uniref:hydantoinase/oxoprolinase family protein n=1 Tax=Methylacidimicrobium sp. AP8 TaxID=2730359 RepID=UPI0018BFAF45|nr:hydantoinase/oxoprolinase family protein [Methylacidimicrobium sp. AP8]CAB4244116.1 Acetophenone carboxylase gamma subunit [Methylacidimicrobium sp. AP8]
MAKSSGSAEQPPGFPEEARRGDALLEKGASGAAPEDSGRSLIRIAVDTGGTFTDCIALWEGRLLCWKLPSTPHAPETALLEGIRRLLENKNPDRIEIIHGTTVGTNAVLERKGACTALLTTEGFEDLLEIGRQNRPKLYDLGPSKPAPLVPAERRFGVPERVGPRGEILRPLDGSAVSAIGKTLRDAGVESVAVVYLFSFANPRHEEETGKLLRHLELPISLSAHVLPEHREYERMSTTVLNAYIAPVLRRYLGRAEEGVDWMATRGADGTPRSTSLWVMRSNGGALSARGAGERPIETLLSGPAAGAVAAAAWGRLVGFPHIIAFDMGGTSTDVCLAGEDPLPERGGSVGGYPIGSPLLPIQTVAAGGGSIARVDAGGALRVGPESAGADPGPVCYGRGEEITVTDAHLCLGRLGSAGLLGGEMPLDADRAREFFARFWRDRMAPRWSASSEEDHPVERLAQGILDVINVRMARAIQLVATESGRDPRDFSLLAYGGAGGLHACDLAEALEIPQALVPRNPGLFSALGGLFSDFVKEYVETLLCPQERADEEDLRRIFGRLAGRAEEELDAEGFGRRERALSFFVDMRYAGQGHELMVPYSEEYAGQFHRLHELRFGYADWGRKTEIVALRVQARGMPRKPVLVPEEETGPEPGKDSLLYEAPVWFGGRVVPTRFYRRERLRPGNRIEGPAVILEYSGTTVVPPSWKAHVDRYGGLLLTRREE